MSKTKNADQLELLMHYTSSHMMIFIGLIAAVASAYKYLEPPLTSPPGIFFILAGIFFCLAGIAIGIIASHIPHYKNFDRITKRRSILFTKPKNRLFRNFKLLFRYKYLEKIENYGFWIGIICSIVALVLPNTENIKNGCQN